MRKQLEYEMILFRLGSHIQIGRSINIMDCVLNMNNLQSNLMYSPKSIRSSDFNETFVERNITNQEFAKSILHTRFTIYYITSGIFSYFLGSFIVHLIV
ncbi:hypothetical protein BDF14DRAFT_1768715 [Spinellus fusiger]|nr:hypothetical protein BDF14DRAFT_1768715 [Spinellus fusiger]